MNANYTTFMVIVTLVVIALYFSSTNFVSAETNCYSSGERWICIFTSDDPPAKAVVDCDKDGKNCTGTWVNKQTVVTPEVNTAIKNALIAKSPEGLTQNSNPSLKNDKGAELSP